MVRAEERVDELRDIIKRHNQAYYVDDAPTIPDAEWDALMRELRSLAGQAGVPCLNAGSLGEPHGRELAWRVEWSDGPQRVEMPDTSPPHSLMASSSTSKSSMPPGRPGRP